MYTQQEISKQRQAFWTTFGQYMRPIFSADGEKVNWVNYRTGVPHIHFKMDAHNGNAYMAIILSHPDADLRMACYRQFTQLTTVLEETTGEQWQWEPATADEHGRDISRIGTELHNVHIAKSEDWPKLISFFKPRIMALDAFWSMAKYGFE